MAGKLRSSSSCSTHALAETIGGLSGGLEVVSCLYGLRGALQLGEDQIVLDPDFLA